MKIYGVINKLLNFACDNLCLNRADTAYVRNNVLDILGLADYEENNETYSKNDIAALLEEFTEVGVADGIFERNAAAYYCDKVMGALSLLPHALDCEFQRVLKRDGSRAAMDFLYDYCVDNNYVKKAVLDKNPRFSRKNLIVTINLSKPEFRDPNKAKSGNSVSGGYPKCVICRENEGLSKRGKCTLRTVSLKLGGNDWFWQFSPYGYFHQHGIAVNTKHIPMYIDKQTFSNLIDFVDQFPDYFLGCNAPLERVGGSVLAHDHYQGGGEKLPLHGAGLTRIFQDKEYPDVNIGIVDWSGSVVRVSGYNKDSVIAVSEKIRQAWKSYTNEKLGIICNDGEKQFNEISPTAYKRCGGYVMNIILRSNITSSEYPDGVFHAHPEFHSVKKESIGLIEAQGLFILPGRLVEELNRVEDCILKGEPLTKELEQFKLVYDEVKAVNYGSTKSEVHSAMENELASICNRILQNTAVFKAEKDFAEFLKKCGFVDAGYEHVVKASGRINIIGEHIDYCGGKVLPAAISLKNVVFVRKNNSDKINIRWTTLPDKACIDIANLDKSSINKHAGFQLGCASVFKRSGRKLVGCDLLYDCAVPFGGGLSSSAAIEVSTLTALALVSGCEIDGRELALLAQQAEREYSGVNCGVMDQYASANGVKNCAMLLDCSTVAHTLAPIDLGDYEFVVANTNKPHSLVDSKYNERRSEVEQALKIIQRKFKVDCLAQVTLSQFEQCKQELHGALYNRVKHVVTECDRVDKAVAAMGKGDLHALGRLLNKSHESLRDDYEVSCRELDVLQSLSVRHEGCVGARMIGGGFGGCVLALVSKETAENFKKTVGAKYKAEIGYEASFYDAEISDGLTVEVI